MDNKLFFQKLSEVANWHWQEYPGMSEDMTYYRRKILAEDIPKYIVIDSWVNDTCPYQADQKGCDIQIKISHRTPRTVIRRCKTCKKVIFRDQLYEPPSNKDVFAFVVSLSRNAK
jgi:hypothetical protein